MAMGFIVPNKEPLVTRRKASDPSELLLTFDNGDGISLHEATHNTIALGSSGTGKTSSVILPALHSLLKAGYAGFVMDIKGNFTEQARALARHCGREADLVEFGTGHHATPVNILSGLDSRQSYEFLRILTVAPFAGRTHSLDWHTNGIRQAADCLELLRILHRHSSEITANLDSLEQVLTDTQLASSMFRYFRKNLFQKGNKAHRDLTSRVTGDEFHVCNCEEKKLKVTGSTYGE